MKFATSTLRYIVRPWIAMFSFFMTRLAGRILRRVMGLQREPVRQYTESDYRGIDQAYGFLAGLAAMGAVVVILLTLCGRPMC